MAGGSPVTWSYYYDAFGRRRGKLSPDSATDEYFYDLGHQMLTDRGTNLSTSERPEDDYIWLGGRPVLMVRAKYNSSNVRVADGSSNFCTRDEEATLCGTYALVTDYIGKPVLTLNESGNTSGTATYEAFGFANRREYRWGSPHSPQGNASTTIAPPMPTGFDGPLRVLTSRSNYSASTTTLAGYSENSVLSGNRAHTWTNWRYASGNSWTLAWTGTTGDYGIDVEAYEVQPKQAYTWWAFTPLRFPGHYYDKETELNENWNRYFDPRTNRYLSPEPMLRSQGFVMSRQLNGRPVPTFAYASNNPLGNFDSTGLADEMTSCQGGVCVEIAGDGLAENGAGGLRPVNWGPKHGLPNPAPGPAPAPAPAPAPQGGFWNAVCRVLPFLAAKKNPTAKDRREQCIEQCKGNDEDAMLEWCDTLPNITDEDRERRRLCRQAARESGRGQIQMCIGTCWRTFDWPNQ